ncbi:MAG: DUF6326 family protein [Acidobacteriota bacterium]
MSFFDRSNAAIPAQQRAFLSTLWIFVLLNVLLRDVQQVFAQGFLRQVVGGELVGQPTGELSLLAVAVLMQAPLTMVVLPWLLSDRPLRIVNACAASLTLLMTGAQVAIGRPDADDLLFAAVKAAALMAIFRATRSRTVTSAAPRNRGPRGGVTAAAVPLLALMALAAATPSAAQQKGQFEIGLGIAALELDDKLGGDTGLGLEVRFGYSVTDRFQIELQHSSASSILDGSFRATSLNGLFFFGEARRKVIPYALLGVGRADARLDDVLRFGDAEASTDDATALRAALGARLSLGADKRTSMRLELTALREDAFGDDATHLGLSSTFLWRLGGGGR